MNAIPKRIEIAPGVRVKVIEKNNQRSGLLTEGIVARILTNSPVHPHGIKVMLTDGKVGRVQAILSGKKSDLPSNTKEASNLTEKIAKNNHS
jgi:uncharacterized repeat protein (TIGR03833 family)